MPDLYGRTLADYADRLERLADDLRYGAKTDCAWETSDVADAILDVEKAAETLRRVKVA